MSDSAYTAILGFIAAFDREDEAGQALWNLDDPSDGMASEVFRKTPGCVGPYLPVGQLGCDFEGIHEPHCKNKDHVFPTVQDYGDAQNEVREMAARKRMTVDPKGMKIDEMRILRNLLDDAIFAEEEKAKKPAEPEGEDGTIITFQKQFNGRQVYMYAGIKARGGWSITGQSGHTGIGWERLLNFIRDKEANPQRAIDTIEVVFTA